MPTSRGLCRSRCSYRVRYRYRTLSLCQLEIANILLRAHRLYLLLTQKVFSDDAGNSLFPKPRPRSNCAWCTGTGNATQQVCLQSTEGAVVPRMPFDLLKHLQLKMLAAENAALRVKLVEQEQAAQLELQDLRKFCIASQEKNTAKDSQAYTDLQQQQQEIINHISTVEAFASQADASMQRISTRLDKVCQCPRGLWEHAAVSVGESSFMLQRSLHAHAPASLISLSIRQGIDNMQKQLPCMIVLLGCQLLLACSKSMPITINPHMPIHCLPCQPLRYMSTHLTSFIQLFTPSCALLNCCNGNPRSSNSAWTL